MDSPKPSDVQDGFAVFHTFWTAAITIAGAVVAFFTKRLVDEVDSKADKCDLDSLEQRFERFLESQDAKHNSNTERLDTIIFELGRRNNGNGRRL